MQPVWKGDELFWSRADSTGRTTTGKLK